MVENKQINRQRFIFEKTDYRLELLEKAKKIPQLKQLNESMIFQKSLEIVVNNPQLVENLFSQNETVPALMKEYNEIMIQSIKGLRDLIEKIDKRLLKIEQQLSFESNKEESSLFGSERQLGYQRTESDK